MITIVKNISLEQHLLDKEKKYKIVLYNKNTNEINKTLNKASDFNIYKDNIEKIKNNELIKVFLNVKNNTNSNVSDVILNILDDKSFKFVHSSIRDNKSKIIIYPLVSDKNLFSLGSIRKDGEMSIVYFVKYVNVDVSMKSVRRCTVLAADNNFIEIDNKSKILQPSLSVLKISTLDKRNIIKIENIGSEESKNIIYTYDIPFGYTIDIGSINYEFLNERVNVKAKKISNTIVFYMDKIPISEENNRKVMTIIMKHKKVTQSLSGVKMSLS